MRVAVYTSNQLRHYALLDKLSGIADVCAVVETTDSTAAGYHQSYKSDVMADYFKRVSEAEYDVFMNWYDWDLDDEFTTLEIPMGDLNKWAPCIEADHHIVFGSSWIKGPLLDFLMSKGAVNLHAGIAPQYRGSSCNFWAMYDNHPEFVGCTLHLLSKGLDSGNILSICRPDPCKDPFEFTMRAVEKGHDMVINWLKDGAPTNYAWKQVEEDKIRYTRAADFTDEICTEYLERLESTQHGQAQKTTATG